MKWVTQVKNVISFKWLPQRVRKVIIAVIGGTIVLIGLALTILPGPAFIVLPLGLALLATEFAWARRVIRRGKVFVGRAGRSDLANKIRSMVGSSR